MSGMVDCDMVLLTLMVPPHQMLDVKDGFMKVLADYRGWCKHHGLVINRRAMSSPKTIVSSIVACEYERRYD